MRSNENIDLNRKRFYEKGTSFKNFSLNEEQKENIAKRKEAFLKKIGSETSGLFLYGAAIEFLANSTIHLIMPTFDERITFLIEILDPNLDIFNDYIREPIITQQEINEASEDDKDFLIQNKQEQLSDFIRRMREKYGFYDGQLIKYESKYAAKMKRSFSFQTGIKRNYADILLSNAQYVKDFTNITDEEFNKINTKAQFYISKAPNPKSPNDLAYNLAMSNPFIRCKTLEEMFALFITIIDPDLQMLTIYEEESIKDKMRIRAKKQLGFFNAELVRLEKAYHQRFLPDKKISIWSL